MKKRLFQNTSIEGRPPNPKRLVLDVQCYMLSDQGMWWLCEQVVRPLQDEEAYPAVYQQNIPSWVKMEPQHVSKQANTDNDSWTRLSTVTSPT